MVACTRETDSIKASGTKSWLRRLNNHLPKPIANNPTESSVGEWNTWQTRGAERPIQTLAASREAPSVQLTALLEIRQSHNEL